MYTFISSLLLNLNRNRKVTNFISSLLYPCLSKLQKSSTESLLSWSQDFMYQDYFLWIVRWLSKVWSTSKWMVSSGYNRSCDMLDPSQHLHSSSQRSSQTDSKNEPMLDWHSSISEHCGLTIVSDILWVKWWCRSLQELSSPYLTIHGIRS